MTLWDLIDKSPGFFIGSVSCFIGMIFLLTDCVKSVIREWRK